MALPWISVIPVRTLSRNQPAKRAVIASSWTPLSSSPPLNPRPHWTYRWSTSGSHATPQESTKTKKRPRGPLFTPAEDAIMRKMIAQRKGFREILTVLPHRTIHSLRRRWNTYARPNIDSQTEFLNHPYNQEDDALILRLRAAGMSWKEIRNVHFPTRTLLSLRLHSHTTLPSFGVTHTRYGHSWTAEEDKKLLWLRGNLQHPWAVIYDQFPERSSAALHNRWKTILRGEGRLSSIEIDSLTSPRSGEMSEASKERDPEASIRKPP